MPSSRRMRVTGLIALLTVCVIFYITNGARSTHNSPFYTRTVQAIQDREAKEASRHAMAEEIERQERMERVQREHEAALSHASPKSQETRPAQPLSPQQPLKQDTMSSSGEGGKSVAGRKMMPDHKKVHYASAKDNDDGVARVGNVGPQSSHAVAGEKDESAEQQKIQDTLNDILKKGPIIIFSKSYCPYSKKAKHILLDMYDISPPPYVVELDLHELGPGLQSTLQRMTGRGTVPNVLINGKSIGGGDDIEALDDEDQLVNKVASMGGKRIVKVQRRPEEAQKTEMKVKRFKA